MSLHQLLLEGGQPVLDFLAAPSPSPAPPPPNNVTLEGETAVPNPLVVIVSSLMVLAIMRWVGKQLPAFKKVDDYGRVVVAILGVGIPFLRLPIVRDLFEIGSAMINAGFASTNARGWVWGGFTAITIALAAVGVWLYFSKGSTKNAFIMAGLAGFLFMSMPWVQIAADWYIDNVAIGFVWAMFRGMYRFADEHSITLS